MAVEMGSPDMKYARSRLGNLLSGIRQNSAGVERLGATADGLDQDQDYGSDYEDELLDSPQKRAVQGRTVKRGGGVVRKEKKVLFELRGKPFELRDNQREESLFSLCRVWVRGKQLFQQSDSPLPFPLPSDESLEVLATKDIYSLPGAKEEAVPVETCPELLKYPDGGADLKTRNGILSSYLPHWKSVKKSWSEHSRKKEDKYAKSISLLRTVYNISQQGQLVG